MLRLRHKALERKVEDLLSSRQEEIDSEKSYEMRVEKADELWKSKNSTKNSREAFRVIRNTLADMCIGHVRCVYCEDSLADEVEHIRPKSLFPELTFVWMNHCFACGPCNGPKNNRYGTISSGKLQEFSRKRGSPILPPPGGMSALIDPRNEDPTEFLELDLGGQTPDGKVLQPTFEFLPKFSLSKDQELRASFTIDVLGLNREVIRKSRENAFFGFRARLVEYADEVENESSPARLNRLKSDLLKTPHLTVFHEMRQQREYLPCINELFKRAPDALTWPLYV